MQTYGESIGESSKIAEDAPKNDIVESKYQYMFKISSPGFDEMQEERRNNYLSLLKQKRDTLVDQKRGIDEILNDIDMPDNESETSSTKNYKKRKPQSFYGRRIMLSEWFFAIPSDLETNWIFKIIPTGKRLLVVAQHSTTTAYTRQGRIRAQFNSNLPGGKSDSTDYNKFTILDCIFNFKLMTYFVLDIIAWNSYCYTNSNVECRYFFLKSNLDQLNESENHSNKIKFLAIPMYQSELNILENALSAPLNIAGTELICDGVLFFHKDSLYSAGLNPLALWLKPYMIPEIFETPVNECFMKQKPKGYTNVETVFKNIQEKKAGHKMETESEEIEELTTMDEDLS